MKTTAILDSMRRLSLFALTLLIASCAPPAAKRPTSVHRIVTLAPNVTEIVYALGSGGLVAGTDEHSNEPAAARRLPKVGGMQPDLERIASLRPDLVIGITAGAHPALRPALAALHLPLLLIRADRLGDIGPSIRRIGEAVGSSNVEMSIDRLNRSLAAAKRQRKHPPRVLFIVWADPLYAGGRDTLAGDLLDLTGAANAAPVSGWRQLSLETVIANPPDIILYADRSIPRAQIDALLSRGVQGEAIAVDEDLFTRAGPRIGAAAARLNGILDEWEQRHSDVAAVPAGEVRAHVR